MTVITKGSAKVAEGAAPKDMLTVSHVKCITQSLLMNQTTQNIHLKSLMAKFPIAQTQINMSILSTLMKEWQEVVVVPTSVNTMTSRLPISTSNFISQEKSQLYQSQLRLKASKVRCSRKIASHISISSNPKIMILSFRVEQTRNCQMQVEVQQVWALKSSKLLILKRLRMLRTWGLTYVSRTFHVDIVEQR